MNKKDTYYHPCPKCGCNLDPGERCDCERVNLISREFPTIAGVSATLLIGYDLSKGTDLACLAIARKDIKHGLCITKIFYGEEAIKMYENLTIVDSHIQYSNLIPDFMKKNFNIPE